MSNTAPSTALPGQAADISAQWLTDVLHDSGALTSEANVAGVDWEPLGEGAGMMSDLALLRLSYSGDAGDAPASVVVKLPAESETNRAVALQFDIYAREVRYYAELDPVCTANGPRIHLSSIDADNNFAIVMEDLSDYQIGDQIVGATLEETEIAIDELAKLHSSFWDKADQIDWVPDIATSDHASIMRDGIVAGWDAMLDAFGQFIPD
ncbi:MAG: ecdysteroid 22-kinase family protein, partial [Gammaproteobacteria bacterium]|nr:ecdysteroid 22-kinase family protein [Gammaproteobacteria bacterium]